nr:retrotransposon protein, putative, Ty1-copia subclass [Tanacetum cinerariifolium]
MIKEHYQQAKMKATPRKLAYADSDKEAPVRTPQQNRVVERRSQMLVEAARTMLIFSRAPLFLWAEAIATACYTQNRSIIHRRFNKTPYELINDIKPDISFLHVFEALCYPKNNSKDIGKLDENVDIGFFIGYSADSCAYRVYNRRTKKIIETMNVTFDELSMMAFEQNSSKPGLQSMTFGQISSGLDLTYAPSTITTQQPTEGEVDLLFEAMYDDYIGGQPSATPRISPAAQAPQNYNMHSMGKTVNELHAMLKLHEQTLPKSNASALNSIRAGKVQKGIFVIELNTILNRSWIYDTGFGTHICNTTQGIRASRKLKLGALSLYMGNGQREVVEAIGAFYLCLPSGLEIVLNNCHYAPSITRGFISVSCLYDDGFVNRFVDNAIQVSRNNVVYFCDVPRDGIFEIDLSNSVTNESSVYAVSNKRAKLDLDSALLWHCRLGHISKKRIEKLQHDGLLNSSDLRAFEKCVSCMSGKMARKPYTHQLKRAKDLLGLIHTDVCGPLKIMSRQGASYFVTFTDDFCRYVYVYLLKHKHEVFETFKVFQKEVENQLGKTIKSLCSDRGGEYMSQEFL